MNTKIIPLGISDYKDFIERGYYYVDKTLLIKDVLDGSQSALFPRPRRFGKTLNLSMLRYFFEKSEESNQKLFVDKEIWSHESYRQYQGAFPVIYLTFKGIREPNWELCYKKFSLIISKEFGRHRYLLDSDALLPYEKDLFSEILMRKASSAELKNSLELLATWLYNHHKQKIILLIDEYDVPIQEGFIKGYYTEVVDFARTLLTDVLKDHSQILERGVLSGILTLAKEGIFSGLNHMKILNLTNPRAANRFGFTQSEVNNMMTYYNMQVPELADWYNGYTFGDEHGIYNPWSVLNCIFDNGALDTYWANTSNNILIRNLIAKAPVALKVELESLIEGKEVTQEIDDSIIFPEMYTRNDLMWSLLLFTGYLTYSSCKREEGKKICQLKIPNKEITYLYKKMINEIFSQSIIGGTVTTLLKALLENNVETVTEQLNYFLMKSISVFDIPKNEPERSYHMFVLGLMTNLSSNYEIHSNRESGLGRYDIMIIPKDKQGKAIIIEFKKASKDLEKAAKDAVEQIKNKKYAASIDHPVIVYGIAFASKEVAVASATL